MRHQARVDHGLVLVDVEPAREDVPAVQGLDERVLVHDGAAGRVDNHDALLHLGQLVGGNDVLRMLLLDENKFCQ
jgi:hypothetical protein